MEPGAADHAGDRMLGVVVPELGGPEVLRAERVDVPRPGAGQVRITVRAAGVNNYDAKVRSGIMRAPDLPFVPGEEAAGVVDAVGPDVSGTGVGDEVLGYTAGGAYAEHALLRAWTAKPPGLDWADAVTIPIAGEAAVRAVAALDPRSGETVLVTGASGVVGSFALQLVLLRGARAVGTTAPHWFDDVADLGAIPVAYGDGMVDRVRAAAPDGIDAALDLAGAGMLPDLVVVRGGTERVVTLADGAAGDVGVPFLSGGAAQQNTAVLERLVAMVIDGDVVLPPVTTFGLDDAVRAHEALASRAHRGKVVLLP
ncbi:NADP-dependent oxidoreductase [Beutenbergia cavernae]|nr:NADP-dependent oxidoreductase [Beutenbergia cavernae]